MSLVQVTFLTAYRGRPDHLRCQREWLERLREEEFDAFEWIVVEGDETPTVESIADRSWTRYTFVPMTGLFAKAALLNRAAALATGSRLCPLDVDLLPKHGTMSLHARLANEAPRMLVTGYRVQLADVPAAGPVEECSLRLQEELKVGAGTPLCPEDNPTALRKYLLEDERFGVCPFYDRADWEQLGGVDEAFVGWGAEDQDFLERVLTLGRVLVRSYDLLYFHLPHDDDAGWRQPHLTALNRERLRSRARQRRLAARVPHRPLASP